MSRATGTFQQKELRAKLLRLEQEIARSRAAAQQMSREAEERLSGVRESIAGIASKGDDRQAAGKAEGRGEDPKKTTKG